VTIPPFSTIPRTPPAVAEAASAVRDDAAAAGRTRARTGGGGDGGWWNLRTRSAPYLFLLPYFAVTAVFFVYPLVYAMILAFYQTDGPARKAYVGLANFRFVLTDPDFHRALQNTLVFTAASLLLQLPMSLALAMLLNGKIGRARGIFRLVIFAPNLVGQVFVGILFGMLFTPRFGLFNKLLNATIGWGLEKQWLADAQLVMPAVVIASLWLYVGFNMIYFLAALQNVDQSLIEAARIDGAGPWQIFLNVTIPAIAPVATFVVVTSTIGSLQLFELPYTLLQNNNSGFGPDNSGLTIVGYLYQYAREAGDLGTAAAVGWVLTCMIFIVSLVQIRLSTYVGSTK
jgi:ABC-type sugar transport system permease subunit